MSRQPAGHHLHDARPPSLDGAERSSNPPTHEVSTIERIVHPDERLIMARDPFDPRWEKVRALRTELLMRRGPIGRADIVALLSPCHHEGRSLLAAELAVAFAQTGRPTLLVDADLRRPHQHLFFGAENDEGLSHAIERGVAPQLHKVQGLAQMSLLTAGAAPRDPLELLSSVGFASMFKDWRDNFEFVVIDTAPVMHFADGLAVASLAGRVLTLSRAQRTPYKDMQDMLRRLAATRSQVLGAVISHF